MQSAPIELKVHPSKESRDKIVGCLRAGGFLTVAEERQVGQDLHHPHGIRRLRRQVTRDDIPLIGEDGQDRRAELHP